MTDRAHDSAPLYDRSFALVFAAHLFFTLANAALAHYARWVEWLGGDVGQVGWVMGVGPVVGLLLRPWMGQWINRLGPVSTWILGIGIFAAGSVGNLLVDTIDWQIYVLRMWLALGAAFVFASSLTYVAHAAPPGRRTEAIGVLGAAGFVGMLSGPWLGDVVLATRDRERFTILFVGATAACILPVLLLLRLRQTTHRDRSAPTTLRGFVRAVRDHWPGMIVVVHLVFGLCIAVPFGFLASYIDHVRPPGASGSDLGVFFLGYGGWGLIVRLGTRRVPDRIGRRRVLLAGMVVMAAGMFSLVAARPEGDWWLLVPGMLCGSGHALMFHTMTALGLERFGPDVRGTGSALALMMLDAGMIIGAPVLGSIAEFAGFAALFAVVGGAVLATALLYTASSVPVWRARAQARRDQGPPSVNPS